MLRVKRQCHRRLDFYEETCIDDGILIKKNNNVDLNINSLKFLYVKTLFVAGPVQVLRARCLQVTDCGEERHDSYEETRIDMEHGTKTAGEYKN